MPLKLSVGGSELSLMVGASGEGLALKGDDINISIHTPFLVMDDFEEKDFEIYFLTKKNVKENDIYQAYLKKFDLRVGWFLPVVSLSSNLHDYADDEHFLKYAYIAIKESINRLDDSLFSCEIPPDIDSLSMVDIFHEDTVLLVLSKEVFPDGYKFDIDRAAPCLVKNGYVQLSSRSPSDVKHQVELQGNQVRVYLSDISEELDNVALVSELLNKSYCFEESPVFKFFLVYQIFEMLIDNVYKFEQAGLVEEISKAEGDTGKTKDALDKLQGFMSEKKRMGLLVRDYSKISKELDSLKYACNRLLNELGRDESNEFESYFYKVRNFIFHQYRFFPKENDGLLGDVVVEAINLLPSLLSKFGRRN